MSYEHLTRLHAILENAGNVAEVEAPDAASPGRIAVSLGADAQDRLYIVNIVFLDDVTEMAGAATQSGEAILIQHALTFPFKAKSEAVPDMLQLITMLNRVLPIGGLLFDATSGELALNYVLLSENRQVPQNVAVQVVSMLDYIVRQYRHHMEAVALGELGCAELLERYRAAAAQAE